MAYSQSLPPDFPVYGLTDAAWSGPRWLRFYEGASGEVPIGIHLAHGRSNDLFADAGPWVEVRSLPRSRFDAGAGNGHGDGSLRDVALYTWMSRGFGSSALHEDQAETEAGGYRAWSTVPWTLDGEAVEAKVVPDNPDAQGAWSAFVETSEVFVVVAARGIRPADIRLARVLDGWVYGMTLTAVLDFPDSIKRSIAQALG